MKIPVRSALSTALLLCVAACTIQTDNGNPVDPGPTGASASYSDTTIALVVNHASYMAPQDTLQIVVTAFAESTLVDSAPGRLANVTIAVSATHGTLSDSTITTREDGRATLWYTTDSAATVELRFSAAATAGLSSTIDITDTPDQIQKLLRAQATNAELLANGFDSTIITAIMINDDHNPVAAQRVKFSTTAGVIRPLSGTTDAQGTQQPGVAITDEAGRAQAVLIAPNINDTAFVTAFSLTDRALSDEISVLISGVTISGSVQQQNLAPDASTIFSVRLQNASGKRIANAPIFFTLAKGDESPFSIDTHDTLTGLEGTAQAIISAQSSGVDSVIVQSAGARFAMPMFVTDLQLLATLGASTLQASENSSTTLSVNFTSATNSALTNRTVTLVRSWTDAFGVNRGDTLTQKTNTSGTAQFIITGIASESVMRLLLSATDGNGSSATAEKQISFIATRSMTIQALPSIIQADGSSYALISVLIKNEKNNPITGDTILFSTDLGTVQQTAITDSLGRATARLISDRRNAVATVSASLASDPSLSVVVPVEFVGVTLQAEAYPPSIKSDGIDSSIIRISLLDAASNPIVGEAVYFFKQLEQTEIVRADSLTNNRGEATAVVRGRSSGVDSIVVSTAAGATQTHALLNYSSNELRISLTGSNALIANGSDSTSVRVSLRRGDGTTPIANADLDISVSLGEIPDTSKNIFARTAKTGSNGIYEFKIINPSFANTATVFVKAQKDDEMTTGSQKITFLADEIHHISLSGTPEVISTSGDRTKITAVAFDSRGNRVSNATISFNLVNGPGGGEYLDPPSAKTSIDGAASIYLVSGSIPSQYKAVWVTAGSFGGLKSDTAKFTIAGPPHNITVRRNLKEGINPKDGTYKIPTAAIVTDINGNPVADGTEVTFSIQVSGFVISYPYVKRWLPVTGTKNYEPELETFYEVLPFEDFNNDFTLNPGEDRNHDGVSNRGEDRNGDGVFNPGPGFEDINKNGRREYRFSYADFKQALEAVEDYPYKPAEPFFYEFSEDTLGSQSEVVWLSYVDFNANGKWDQTEELSSTDLSDSAYQALDGVNPRTGQFWDIDWESNGVPDPKTAVSITRTVSTKDGIAHNEIVYGQSDANRIEVMIWAESKGRVTTTPEKLILPVIED